MKKCFSLVVRSCAFGACLLATTFAATAAVINLNIDPTQSSLSLTGGAFGLTYNPQTAGANMTSLSGTITADLTGGVFTFSGGSGIVFDVNPNGPFTTAPNDLGVVPGNYGVTASGLVNPFGQVTVNGVYRNLTLDVLGGSAQNGLAMSGGVLKFTGGVLDFGAATQFAGNVPGSSNITAQANNTAGGSVIWDGTTLTFPVLFVTQGGNGRVENLSGVVVARVPEPSSLALVSVLGLTALTRKRRTMA
jgi:hypothetical protein